MNNTLILYDERKGEIDYYFTVMENVEEQHTQLQGLDASRLLRILKSNFLLMLYNLVEACIASGISEIYESLRANTSSYTDLIVEVRSLWSNYEIGKVYSSTAGRTTYEGAVQTIINHVITNQPILLSKEAMNSLCCWDSM